MGMVHQAVHISSRHLERDFYVMAPKILQEDLVWNKQIALESLDLQQHKGTWTSLGLQKPQSHTPTQVAIMKVVHIASRYAQIDSCNGGQYTKQQVPMTVMPQQVKPTKKIEPITKATTQDGDQPYQTPSAMK